MTRWFRNIAVAIALSLAPVAPAGCAHGQTTAQTVLRDATVSANATAHTLETTQALALVMYRTEQELAIAASTDRVTARANVAVVRAAWVPVWEALDKARSAYSELVAILGSKVLNEGAVQSDVNHQAEALQKVTEQIAAARTRIQKAVQQ